LDDLDKPLENLDIADDNSKFQLETEVADSVFALFENKYTEVLQNFFQNKNSFNFKKELQNIIKTDEIKDNLTNFFENFVIGDAFFDIYQLYRNNKLIDKTEIYLYFYEISLGNEKFPVFYIPITINKEEGKFIFQFEKRIFVNTKAIDFVVQEFNLQTNKKSTLVGQFERILYINGEDNFSFILKDYIKKIENFFELNKNIDYQNSEFQKGMNLITSFSNKSYLFLFDKSDEALINDYEEILNDHGDIIDNFSSLLNGFIEEDPKPFMGEIEDEWHEKDISEKLVFESPIPLNDEQKQVLMALQKPDCNFMILEGPPGTGKSHTITAIICKSLLEEKSVLVLSDKKEALDVVEDKVASTLNKIRHEDDFQNPILRLGKTGNKFYKIVQGQTIQKIKEHYNAYKYKKEEYDGLRKDSLHELEKNIKENIEYFENIDIKDVKIYFQNIEKFSKINWINSIEECNIDLLKIKNTIQKLSRYDDKIKINKKLLDDKIFEALNDYQKTLNTLHESKIKFAEKNNNIKIDELVKYFDKIAPYNENIPLALTSIKEALINLDNIYKKNPVISDLFRAKTNLELETLKWCSKVLNTALGVFSESKRFLGEKFRNFDILSNFEIPKDTDPEKAITELQLYIDKLNALKLPVLGFLFKNKEVENITRNLKKTFSYFDMENPQNHIRDIQQISDLFNFIYNKIPNEYKKEKTEHNSLYLLFKVSIDLLNNNSEEYLSEYKEFKKLQDKIIREKEKVKPLEPLPANIEDLEYEIKKANWNIEIFKEIERIKSINIELSDIMPVDIKIVNEESIELFFDNKIKKSLNKIISILNDLRTMRDGIDFVLNIKDKYPNFAKNIDLKISIEDISKTSCILLNCSDQEIEEYLKHKILQSKLEKQFNSQPEDRFLNSINEIEDLTTARMTYFLDKRIIEYTQNHANEVGTLKNIVRKKKKFPKDLFQNLKKAFPCILAGIRDYAEFIPLEKNLFDLIIIDEASQVSIAQALPALIRGKQIIVLGDDKQFSNVKANNASKVTNQELKRRVQDVFLEEKTDANKNGWLEKVKENFDIKNSILKFLRFIRNYECQLKKHFRCYPEIISYSDKYFYDNTLQCMKIRGKKIEDVIKIDIIDHDGKVDENKNTNELEAKYIIEKIKEFKKSGIEQSLGIITPHREQVTLLFDKINELPERDWIFGRKCKLKIMTFDTCQGEERDYIFYSMVATKEKDRLNWIFLKDFSSIADEIDGTIKSQRMNVGFSRAKECIHFVLSKPIEEFQGEIKNAMLHYQNELKIGKKRIMKKMDSKMEYKIDEIFHNTKFYKENKDNIEFIPQFELGKYLKQLNRDYSHPNYKVDFLLIFNGLKIVIEYDGFKEHFIDREEVNESNYKYYMKDDDIYRQKVLEGYGYKFLRINRFNIGDDPIETLDSRLQNLVKKNFKIN
jgi:superfamily I DNA and/or RNA helicase/very-short-patch-repair endonuclease